MAEWKLFDGDIPHVSTAEFHRDRLRAPHLEQEAHRPRLERAAELVRESAALHRQTCKVAAEYCVVTVSDLGCGDGGLLSLLSAEPNIKAWGYDFQPSNVAGWTEREVYAEALDIFGADRPRVALGTTTVVTEVLEHLAAPDEAVRWIGENSQFIVASSPWDERPGSHDICHAWAFDHDGYKALIEQGGYRILRHETVNQFQIILGERT